MDDAGWTDIAERLPPSEGKYLVCAPYSPGSYDPARAWMDAAWWHPEVGDWSLIPDSWAAKVRWWRPMPPPPAPPAISPSSVSGMTS